MKSNNLIYDVIVIGAGASGLMAALELSLAGKKVLIIESSNKIGGRILNIADKEFRAPVEIGAEFIHGDLPLTQQLVEKAGLEVEEIKGSIWKRTVKKFEKQKDFIEGYEHIKSKYKQLETDIDVAKFIETCLADQQFEEARKSIKKYVEGYYAADLNYASTQALIQDWENSSNKEYRLKEGYDALVKYLESKLIRAACDVKIEEPVNEINWGNAIIKVTTNNSVFRCKQVLLTVSLGVIKHNEITFTPSIKNYIEAAVKLGYGSVIKLVYQFKEPFWQKAENSKLKDLSFLFSDEIVPTWWSHYPREDNILIGWLAGPNAENMTNSSDEELIEAGLSSLSRLFKTNNAFLRDCLVSSYVKNWSKDSNFYGGYSYEVVDGKKYKEILRTPIKHQIYFAGEALADSVETGTVEAALQSGRNTAFQLISNY